MGARRPTHSMEAVDLTGADEQPAAAAAAAQPAAAAAAGAIDLTDASGHQAGGGGGGGGEAAAASSSTYGAAAAGGGGASGGGAIDLATPSFDLMAEARNLCAIFPDLRPANILAVLMEFSDYHDDPVAIVSTLLAERTGKLGPESLARLPHPTDVHGPPGAAAFNEVDSAVTSVLAVFPNADPTALRAMVVKRQEEGVEDLVGVVSASMLEGYTRVSDAAAKQADSTPPHLLPWEMEEFIPQADGYEGREFVRQMVSRPELRNAESTVPAWAAFLGAEGRKGGGYGEWVEYAISARFPMVSLPHLRSRCAGGSGYRAAYRQLLLDIVEHGGDGLERRALQRAADGGGLRRLRP